MGVYIGLNWSNLAQDKLFWPETVRLVPPFLSRAALLFQFAFFGKKIPKRGRGSYTKSDKTTWLEVQDL